MADRRIKHEQLIDRVLADVQVEVVLAWLEPQLSKEDTARLEVMFKRWLRQSDRALEQFVAEHCEIYRAAPRSGTRGIPPTGSSSS